MRVRRFWVAGLSFIGAAGSFGTLAEGCVSSSNPSGPDLDAAGFDANVISTFDATGSDATGFDATGLDANPFNSPDGSGSGGGDSGGGGNDGSTPADGGGGLDGSASLDAAPQLLVTGLPNAPGPLTLGGGYLFWVPNVSSGPDSDDVDVLNLADGGLTAITNISTTVAMTTDATGAYWMIATDIYELTYGAATPVLIGNGAVPFNNLYSMTNDATNLYFAEPTGIFRFPKAGAAKATALIAGFTDISGFVFAGTNAYIAHEGAGTDGGGIAVIPQSDLGVDAGADAAVPIVTGQTYPVNLATDGAHLVWTDNTYPGSVYSADLDGGALVQYAATQITDSFATDGTSIYWPTLLTLSDGGFAYAIEKAPIGSPAAAQVFVTTSYGIDFMTVDDTWLYWTDTTHNGVYRALK